MLAINKPVQTSRNGWQILNTNLEVFTILLVLKMMWAVNLTKLWYVV